MSVIKGYHDPDKEYDYTYLALGAGIQSTALLLMCNKPELREKYNVPLPDIAVFSDTQGEPEFTTDQVKRLQDISDIKVITATAGNLGELYINGAVHGKHRFSSIPCFVKAQGEDRPNMVPRHCTRDFKIIPMERAIRGELGYIPRQRVKENVRALIGISFDEATRMKPNSTRWIDNQYPLVDARIRRDQCLEIIAEYDWPMPEKSACIFCPFRSNAGWQYYKTQHPEVFQEAVEFDRSIRDQSKTGLIGQAYLHRQCKPLDEIDFVGDQMTFDFFVDECHGHCGV